VRSAYVLAALLMPGVAVAQTTTTSTTTGPDGRTMTVTTTRSPDGANSAVVRPAPQSGGAPAVPLPNGLPQRDTRPVTASSVIRGRVIDASTGAPLRRAGVRIFSPEIRESRVAMTDAQGRYDFTDLPAGQFNLNVTKAGYIDIAYGQKAPSEPGKPLKLGDNQ